METSKSFVSKKGSKLTDFIMESSWQFVSGDKHSNIIITIWSGSMGSFLRDTRLSIHRKVRTHQLPHKHAISQTQRRYRHIGSCIRLIPITWRKKSYLVTRISFKRLLGSVTVQSRRKEPGENSLLFASGWKLSSSTPNIISGATFASRPLNTTSPAMQALSKLQHKATPIKDHPCWAAANSNTAELPFIQLWNGCKGWNSGPSDSSSWPWTLWWL